MRPDGRRNNELRKPKVTRDFLKTAEGSVLMEMGDTKVICTASVEDRVPPFLKDQKKGWITADRQIGQTGKTIRPKLYIAAGISGAIQHRVGVEGADTIVAINTDPNAQIFEFAHLGIVADATKLLPALTEAFRKRLSVNRLAS